MNKRDRIVEIISNIFFVGKEYTVGDSVSLFETGVFDSIGIMELVAKLEEAFAISIEDHEVMPENLDSVTAIIAFLEAKGITDS